MHLLKLDNTHIPHPSFWYCRMKYAKWSSSSYCTIHFYFIFCFECKTHSRPVWCYFASNKLRSVVCQNMKLNFTIIRRLFFLFLEEEDPLISFIDLFLEFNDNTFWPNDVVSTIWFIVVILLSKGIENT